MLVRALAYARDDSLKLVVAGDGPLRDELERLLGIRSSGATRFLGSSRATSSRISTPVPTPSSCRARRKRRGSFWPKRLRPAPSSSPRMHRKTARFSAGAGRVVAPTPEAFAAALRRVSPGNRPEAAEARQAALRFSIERQVDRIQALYESLVRPVRIA